MNRREVYDHSPEEATSSKVPSCYGYCLTAWAGVQIACVYIWQSGLCSQAGAEGFTDSGDAKDKGEGKQQSYLDDVMT